MTVRELIQALLEHDLDVDIRVDITDAAGSREELRDIRIADLGHQIDLEIELEKHVVVDQSDYELLESTLEETESELRELKEA